MRVIAGKYKGIKLTDFDVESTRPTLDRVKENIFNVISLNIVDSVVVDLFAGTGALGIEALSRGALEVSFVDTNRKAVNIILQNLAKLKVDADVHNMDYMQYLKYLQKQGNKVDIFILDPPFKSDFAEKAIQYIYEHDLLANDGVIVWERGVTDKPVTLPFDCKLKQYGTVQVAFLYKEKL